MFQSLRLPFIIIVYTLVTMCYCSLRPYIIYTSTEFSSSANAISNLHENIIPQISGSDALETEIIYIENMTSEELRGYLDTFYNECSNISGETVCDLDENCSWTAEYGICLESPKYLLIIGDENIIPSLSTDGACSSNILSDDLYNRDFAIGRLIVSNNQEAMSQINKIINYVQFPEPGIWKNEILLLADNEIHPTEPNPQNESGHTINTSNIYNTLSDKSLVNTLYATEFPLQPSTSGGNTQPELTEMIINTINSGVGLINYIGHGTHQSLAHELLLEMENIDQLHTNNKPPIWVVGTCSFGQYINKVCMAEELLKTDDAAIAIIATTHGVGATTNNEYLSNFYNRIGDYVDGNTDRLGDIFKKAKLSFNDNICTPYKFQLFGDPALPVLLSHKTSNLFQPPNSVIIGNSNSIDVNTLQNEQAYIKILGQDIVGNLEEQNYLKPGPLLFESYFDQSIDFYVPIEVSPSETVKIIIAKEEIEDFHNNIIQIESSIDLELDINSDLFEDTQGPIIRLYNNDIEITQNSTIFPPYNFRIDFYDELPLNLSGYNFHYLRFWINDEQYNSMILNDLYDSETSSVQLFFEDSKFTDGDYILNVEAWDILSNHSIINYFVNIGQTDGDEIYNVYNFPNPFEDKTFFTFYMKNPEPIIITIDIYSANGKKINTLSEEIDKTLSYHVFPESGWNGTDKFNSKLSNGTYFYHLDISDPNGRSLHSKMHNITILK